MNFQTVIRQIEAVPNRIPKWVEFWLGNVVIVLLGWMFGKSIGHRVTRMLVNSGFNEIWQAPWKHKGRMGATDSRRINHAEIFGGLFRWTIYATTAYIILRRHEYNDAAYFVADVLRVCWAVALVVVCGAFVGRMLSAAVVDFLLEAAGQNTPNEWQGSGQRSLTVMIAPLAGTIVYGFVFLLMSTFAVALLPNGVAHTSLQVLFQFALRVLATCIVLLIGWVGVRWTEQRSAGTDHLQDIARDSRALPMKSESTTEATPEAFRLTLILMTISAAFMTFLGSLGSAFFGWLILLFIASTLFALRHQINEIFCGIFMAIVRIKSVDLEGTLHVLKQRGAMASIWEAGGQIVQKRNSVMLSAYSNQAFDQVSPEPPATPQAGKPVEQVGQPVGATASEE